MSIGESAIVECSVEPNINILNLTILHTLNSKSTEVPIEIVQFSPKVIVKYFIQSVNKSNEGSYMCTAYNNSGYAVDSSFIIMKVGRKPIAPKIKCEMFDNGTVTCCLTKSKEQIHQETLLSNETFTFDFFFIYDGNRLLHDKSELECITVFLWPNMKDDVTLVEAQVNVSNILGSDMNRFSQRRKDIEKPTLMKMITCPDKYFVGIYLQSLFTDNYTVTWKCLDETKWRKNNRTLSFTKDIKTLTKRRNPIKANCAFINGHISEANQKTESISDEHGEVPYQQILLYYDLQDPSQMIFAQMFYWTNLKPHHNFNCNLSLAFKDGHGLENGPNSFKFQLQQDAPSNVPTIFPFVFQTSQDSHTFYFKKVDQVHLNGELSHYEYKCPGDDYWKIKSDIETTGPFVTCNKLTISDSFTFQLKACSMANCSTNFAQIQKSSTKPECSIPDFRLVQLKRDNEYEILTSKQTNETIFFICYKYDNNKMKHDCANVQMVRLNSHQNNFRFFTEGNIPEMRFAMASFNDKCDGISIWSQWKSDIFQIISANETISAEFEPQIVPTKTQIWSLSRQIKVNVTLPTSYLLVQSISLSINCDNNFYKNTWSIEDGLLPIGKSFLLKSLEFFDRGPCDVNFSYKTYGDSTVRILMTDSIKNYDPIYIGLLTSFMIIFLLIITIIGRLMWVMKPCSSSDKELEADSTGDIFVIPEEVKPIKTVAEEPVETGQVSDDDTQSVQSSRSYNARPNNHCYRLNISTSSLDGDFQQEEIPMNNILRPEANENN